MICEGCGCTENDACFYRGLVCWWARPNLCSFCAYSSALTDFPKTTLRPTLDIETGGLL
jgi:hypothetical protein